MNCLTAEIFKKELIVSPQSLTARVVNFIEEKKRLCAIIVSFNFMKMMTWFIFSTKNCSEWFSSDTAASLGYKDPIPVLSQYRGSRI